MYSFLICKKMYFLCVIRQKERKSFFLLHLLTNEDGEIIPF